MGRGLERRALFPDDPDRDAFLGRLAALADSGALTVYAWALLPNHAHLLVRTGTHPLPRSMRSLLTGYAQVYNRRHRRHGHLFQNRYKSIVCQEDTYFRELVRYIHLNPLRARLVADLPQLDRYPWGGHAGILGRGTPAWQDRAHVLAWFGRTQRAPLRAYRDYIREGIPQGRRPELVGGGLVRSLGGWAEVRAIRRHGDRVLADPCVLGTGEFVERMLAADAARQQRQPGRGHRLRRAQTVIRQRCRREQVSVQELRGGADRAGSRLCEPIWRSTSRRSSASPWPTRRGSSGSPRQGSRKRWRGHSGDKSTHSTTSRLP